MVDRDYGLRVEPCQGCAKLNVQFFDLEENPQGLYSRTLVMDVDFPEAEEVPDFVSYSILGGLLIARAKSFL